MVELMSDGLRSPEVARRLGIDGADVYRLLFVGDLDGGPGRDGLVYFSEASVDAYLERFGFGNLSNNLSNERRRTGPYDGERSDDETSPDLHEGGPSRTRQQGRKPKRSLITRRSRVQIPPPIGALPTTLALP